MDVPAREGEGDADEDLGDEEEGGYEDKKEHGQKDNSVFLWIGFPIGDLLDPAPLQKCLPNYPLNLKPALLLPQRPDKQS